MVAALTRIFGVHNIGLAEDVVQEAFCRAIEVWRFRGMPENPSAWLMATAKNCAIDALRRERTARTFAPELGRLLQSEWMLAPVLEEQFGPHAIKDDLLRMMFSCCGPRLPEESQVALVLHILCGFSVVEIASAFISGILPSRSGSPAPRGFWRNQRHYSTSERPPISRHGYRQYMRPCTFSLTRATTVPRLKQPCGRNFAGRRCDWPRYC